MFKGKASSDMHADVQHNSEFPALGLIGFEWHTELVDQFGQPFNKQVKKNLYPVEGLNATLNLLLGALAKPAGAYIGLFVNNYTPNGSEVAATVSSVTGETNLFANPTVRPQWVASAPAAGGNINNYSNKAVFTFTGPAVITGGFLICSSAVFGTGGPLLSIVAFGSPYQVYNNTVLNVGAGCTLASA